MPSGHGKFRTFFWFGAALLFGALLLGAFWPRSVPVDFTVISAGPMSVSVRDQGYTRARDVYSLTAPVTGRLMRLEKEAGDLVDVNEVVARLLPSDSALLDSRSEVTAEALVRSAEAALSVSRSELARAEAQAEYARIEAARNESLFAMNGVAESTLQRARLDSRIAESALETARSSFRMRQAELDVARARLLPSGSGGFEAGEMVEVRSPSAGRVLRILQESESVVSAGAALLEVGDPANLEAVVELLSSDAVQVQEGGSVIMDHWGSGQALYGIVRRVEPFGYTKVSALGVEEQRVNVVIDFVGAPETWAGLGHGYRIEGAITVWEEQNVLQVPVASLFRSEGSWAVFRVESGRAHLVHVEIGRNNGETAQVLSGLQAGHAVILYPGYDIADGAAVSQR